uniref:Uncharacterized protein n=1 Tax=Avena sativa TaxID=4498 RepID=A0ACD5YCI3_AVESA
MTLRSIVRDFRERFGNLSRGKSLASSDQLLQDSLVVTQQSCWASLPPELLRGVLKRLKQDDGNWPSRKDVVACASVCTTWRDMCKGIVRNPEFCGKFMLPVSLKQPGPGDGLTQCFIKRDKSKLTYHLYLSLTPDMIDDKGKFLLSAKRCRRMIYTDYAISMDSKNISRSSSGYIGRLRSNFLGSKYIIYDTQPPYNARTLCLQERRSRGFFSRKVSSKVKTGSYSIAQVKYEKNVLGLRGPRQMQCTMHSIPTSALDPGGIVPGEPKELLPRLFEESFRTTTSSFSIAHHSMDFGGCRSSEFGLQDGDARDKEMPLVLGNKAPRWHTELQRWCLNFHGRVTVASVKNFQLVAAAPAPQATGAAVSELPSQPRPVNPSSSSDHDTVILQFGKVSKDTFTMDYRYPLSAFQAFAICLTSFDTEMACE